MAYFLLGGLLFECSTLRKCNERFDGTVPRLVGIEVSRTTFLDISLLRKLLLVRFYVAVWVLLSVFSIFCITSSLVIALVRITKKLRIILRFWETAHLPLP